MSIVGRAGAMAVLRRMAVFLVAVSAVASVGVSAAGADPPWRTNGSFEGNSQAWAAVRCHNDMHVEGLSGIGGAFFALGVPATFSSEGECVAYFRGGGTVLLLVGTSGNNTVEVFIIVNG